MNNTTIKAWIIYLKSKDIDTATQVLDAWQSIAKENREDMNRVNQEMFETIQKRTEVWYTRGRK